MPVQDSNKDCHFFYSSPLFQGLILKHTVGFWGWMIRITKICLMSRLRRKENKAPWYLMILYLTFLSAYFRLEVKGLNAYLAALQTLRWTILTEQWIDQKIVRKDHYILIILKFSRVLHLVMSLVKKKWRKVIKQQNL